MSFKGELDPKFWLTLNVFLSSPIVLYAFSEPSGRQPKDISIRWWADLDEKTKFLSILNGSCSLIVNVLGHGLFLQAALEKLTDYSTYKEKKVYLSLFMGFCSAIAGAVLAYDAFLWAGSLIKSLAAISVFIGTAASRFIGFYTLASLMNDFKLRRFQRVMATDVLKSTRLLAPYMESHLSSVINFTYIKEVSDIIYVDRARNHIKLKSISNYFHLYYDLVFCIIFSTVLIPAIFVTFLEKALRGMALLSNNVSDEEEAFPGMDLLTKLKVSLLPAIASSFFYIFSILFFAKSLASYLTVNKTKKRLSLLIMLFMLNLFASRSMFNVGRGVVQGENIFSISSTSLYGRFLPYMNMLAVFMANTNACISHYNKKLPELTASRFTDNPINAILYFLEEFLLPEPILRKIESDRSRLFSNNPLSINLADNPEEDASICSSHLT